ncbi:MAG: TlpA family protein disulfide reductase [Acidobacteria bacterium]|nr:TlpA family protein disulfide reductase [Acidobacteriota bacterium]
MRTFAAFLFLTAGFAFAEDVNQPAPDLDIKMENGQTVKLNSFKGKPLVLQFFSTTCPHCQKSAESLEKVLRTYGPKGVQVLAVVSDENQRKDFGEFRKKYGATYPMGSIGNQEAYRFFSLSVMRPFYVPTFAFIDRNGVIRERFIGGLLQNNPNGGPALELAELTKHVDGLLKAAPVKSAAAVHPAPKSAPAQAKR